MSKPAGFSPFSPNWSAFRPLLNLPIAHTYLPWDEPVFLLVKEGRTVQHPSLNLAGIQDLLAELPSDVYAEAWRSHLVGEFPQITLLDQGIATGYSYFPWHMWNPACSEAILLAAIHHAYAFHCLQQARAFPNMYLSRLESAVFLLPPEQGEPLYWLSGMGGEVEIKQARDVGVLIQQLREYLPLKHLLGLPTLLRNSSDLPHLQGWMLHDQGIASWSRLPLTFPHTPPLPHQSSLYWWDQHRGQVIAQSQKGYGAVFHCQDWKGVFSRTLLRDLLQISPYSPYSGNILLLPFELLRLQHSVSRYFPETPILSPA